jgi:hypothetical protein
VVAALSAQDWRDVLQLAGDGLFAALAQDVQGAAELAGRDMEAFVATVTDPDRADRLSIAISGRGAFRRFKDVLARWPDELERWYRVSNERERGRASLARGRGIRGRPGERSPHECRRLARAMIERGARDGGRKDGHS